MVLKKTEESKIRRNRLLEETNVLDDEEMFEDVSAISVPKKGKDSIIGIGPSPVMPKYEMKIGA